MYFVKFEQITNNDNFPIIRAIFVINNDKSPSYPINNLLNFFVNKFSLFVPTTYIKN